MYSIVPTVCTRKRPFYYLPTTVLTGDGDLCIQYIRQGGYVPVTCYLYAVPGMGIHTYDDDEDDDHHDMTRCKIHRDAALREAKERERSERGLGREGGKLAWRGRGW